MINIYARHTQLKSITKEDAMMFVTEHHRDGCPRHITGFVAYSLLYAGDIVAVAIFGNPRTSAKQLKYSSELVRLAFKTDMRIVGGASKLIKGFIKHNNPYDLFTYQDTTGEDTDVYVNAGMSLVSQTPTKDYLVRDGYTLETASRKQKFGMAYATQYGPDRIIGTTFGQESGLTNKELFIQAGYHVETTTGDKVYEWFNPNWTHYVYEIVGDDGKYYIGVHSEPIAEMSIDDCITDGYTGSGKRLVNYLHKHKHTKSIIGIYPTRSHAFKAERKAIGNSWEVDENCLNLCIGGKGSAKRQVQSDYAVAGVNDIATLFPELITEWHTSNTTAPSEHTQSSTKIVHWVCDKGHEWDTTIQSRTSGKGCAVCSNKRKLSGFNDLFALRPHLEAQWDYEKNTISPKGLPVRSKEVVWWKCEHGHSWEASIASRSRATDESKVPKCPYCSGRLAISGENDLATLHPNIANQWDYDKNTITPNQLLPKSGKKVSWKCEHGHEWDARPCDRVAGSGCPYCSGQRAIIGETDLASQRPDILSEWDYDRNTVEPSDVTTHSGKKVYWKCESGHEWEAPIYLRTRPRASKCPHCVGHYTTKTKDTTQIE